MISAIDKIIGFYQIQASAMRILLANTQKAFNEGGQSFEREFEKELKEMEARVKKKLKKFDKTLDGTNGWLKRLKANLFNECHLDER